MAKVEADKNYNKASLWEKLRERVLAERIGKDDEELFLDMATSSPAMGAIKGLNKIKALHIADKIAGASGSFDNYLQKLIEELNIKTVGSREQKNIMDLWGSILLDAGKINPKKGATITEQAADIENALLKSGYDELIEGSPLPARPVNYTRKPIKEEVQIFEAGSPNNNYVLDTFKEHPKLIEKREAIKKIKEVFKDSGDIEGRMEGGVLGLHTPSSGGIWYTLPLSKPERGAGILAHELEHAKDYKRLGNAIQLLRLQEAFKKSGKISKYTFDRLPPEEQMRVLFEYHHADSPYGVEAEEIIRLLGGPTNRPRK